MREMLSSASSFFHFWEELGPRNPSGNNLVLSYQWRTGLTPKLPPKGWKKLLSNSQPLIFPCHPKSMISFIVCRSLKPPTTTLTHLHRPRLVLRLRHRLRSTTVSSWTCHGSTALIPLAGSLRLLNFLSIMRPLIRNA